MLLQLVSDLHLEFLEDGGAELLEALPALPGVDALLVAGDLCGLVEPEVCAAAIEALARRFPRVLWVLGNHEYYGLTVEEAQRRARALRHPALTLLEPGVVAEVAGRRVLGATLWFADAPGNDRVAPAYDDFLVIEGFVPWVYEENRRARAWLARELREGDVVVTHHLPTPRSVSPRFAHSPLNRFYLCDVEDLIRERRPALWAHGHAHASQDYAVGPTRVVCNPRGVDGAVNAGFDPGKALALDDAGGR